MNNLQRRPSGIWVARLVVPRAMRKAIGRREFVQSTGTQNATIAKLVASSILFEWRRKLASIQIAEGLAKDMDDQVLRLVEGSPLLAQDGTLPLRDVEALSGIPLADLLRAASRREMRLFARTGRLPGHLVPLEALEVDDPALGRRAGVVIPNALQMPKEAVRVALGGLMELDSSAEIASGVLAADRPSLQLLAFQAPGRPGWLFVPDEPAMVDPSQLEVMAAAADRLRRHLADTVSAERIEHARTLRKAGAEATASGMGTMAARRFTAAVEAYCGSPDGLAGGLASELEQGQRKKGLLLFAEFMGDMPLRDIDGDTLRKFRDGPLKRLPAHANRLPKGIKRKTMKETLEALNADGREWPTMTPAMQRERLFWLFRLFAWLNEKGYLKPDPAAPLRGETGMTKAERKERARASGDGESPTDDEGRGPFSPGELRAIFGMPHFQTGNGAHLSRRNQVWYPFEYWLPLLGLFAGCRIKEACQLHLSDVRCVDGIWCLDLNERTADKSLKNPQSKRIVPIHRQLLDLGFIDYCEALRRLGYKRVFPELSHSKSDARYAKEPIRKMSAMLKSLGMPRDNQHVFHCLRHNANNALARVPLSELPFRGDENLKKFIRYKLLGHKPGDDVNVSHYTDASVAESAALLNAVSFDLPTLKAFDTDYGVKQVALALARKQGDRHGLEDMGPVTE